MKESFKFIWLSSSISCPVGRAGDYALAVRQGGLVPVVQVKVSWSLIVVVFAIRSQISNVSSKWLRKTERQFEKNVWSQVPLRLV